MSVYTELEDGTLVLFRADRSIATIEAQIQATQIAAGFETSPCIKETLAFGAGTSLGSYDTSLAAGE